MKVPAGTYKDVYMTTGECDANGVKMSFTYYFAKDVGMIKQVTKLPGQVVTLELEKFEQESRMWAAEVPWHGRPAHVTFLFLCNVS